jgi:hypothetical protein
LAVLGAGDVRGDWGGSLSGEEGVELRCLVAFAPGDGGGGDSDGEGDVLVSSFVCVASALSEAMSSTAV